MATDITKKLLAVQTKLNAPKNQYNKFGGYAYRSAEDILEAVKPLLEAEGLTLTLTDTIVEICGRFYVCAIAALRNGEATLRVEAYAREDEHKKGMDGAQVTGAASSYARKYALNGLFLIDDNKDADTNENHQIQQSAPEPEPVWTMTDYQRDYISQLAVKAGMNADTLAQRFKIKSVEDMTEKQYNGAVKRLKELIEEAGAND